MLAESTLRWDLKWDFVCQSFTTHLRRMHAQTGSAAGSVTIPGHSDLSGPAWPRLTARGPGALLPQPHRQVDRAAVEAELLPEPALDEPPVAGLQEAGREQDEVRRPGPGLGREEDLRLLAATDGRGGRRDQRRQPGVEPAGGHPGFPAGEGLLERRD